MEMVRSDSKSEKKAEMVLGGLSGLNEDVQAAIFDRIHIKQLTRMKCSSKAWFGYISQYRQSKPRSSNSTFVCQYKFGDEQENQVFFLNVKEQLGGNVVVETLANYHSHLVNSIDNTKPKINFVGSSNGLIICKSCNSADDNDTVVPYVASPILNQWFSLPPISIGKRKIIMGLAFDGVPQHHFKVLICYSDYLNKYRKYMNCHIYSSDTGNWRNNKAILLSSISETSYMVFDDTSYVYRKGVIHWILNQYLLFYHFEKDFFKIYNLGTTVRRLWESEGYLYYAATCGCGFSIWKLMDDADALYDPRSSNKDIMGKWQCKHVLDLFSLDPCFRVFSGSTSLEELKASIQLLGFDDDLQILYLALPEAILSFSFENQRFGMVSTCRELCGIKDPPKKFLEVLASFSMQPRGVDLSSGADCKLLCPQLSLE
ncbi:hypothetical protein AQUCO_00400685v1 [Aquilegia coerulea]|uniref:F-box protein At3g26010-like beta-propeller domain-containing protein n=1 Tax=Aquilegia coerulea TaxID=218851 RepID=A0A2G5EW66_AQUCA|nr:hypothetical protein AQUCO_00400685v1 [Aquilegia coerulea]